MNITDFLLARITEEEVVAKSRDRNAPIHYTGCYYYSYSLDAGWECDCDEDGKGTARILAECAAKRAIIAAVSGWAHDYNDEDNWYSCGLAVTLDQFADDKSPGSGCSNEERRGTCDCGLERRQMRILAPLAAVYADHPDYNQEWKI